MWPFGGPRSDVRSVFEIYQMLSGRTAVSQVFVITLSFIFTGLDTDPISFLKFLFSLCVLRSGGHRDYVRYGLGKTLQISQSLKYLRRTARSFLLKKQCFNSYNFLAVERNPGACPRACAERDCVKNSNDSESIPYYFWQALNRIAIVLFADSGD